MTSKEKIDNENPTAEQDIMTGVVTETGSNRFSLGKKDWKSILIGGVINTIGQIFVWTPYMLGYIADPKIVAVLSFLSPTIVNIGRKFIANTKGYEVVILEEDKDEPESTAVKKL